jgi:molecular chaperone DnaK (HSP70)
MSGEIGQHVNTAITSMQFQDMTSQLIDRTLRRVAGLREFLGTLSEHGAEIAPETDSDEIVERLGKVSMALAIQSLELRSMLRKSVDQHHLASGDIELF